MDPRAKLILTIAFIVAVFFCSSFFAFGLLFLFLLISILASKIKIRLLLRSIRGIIYLIIFTAILNLFFYGDENANVYFSWWIFTVTDKSLIITIQMALRLLFLIIGTSVLTLTTTPIRLTDGIESLLKPLKLIRFPVHELALIMSIALRFIPTLMDETDRIIKAQKARGADFESGNIFKRARALIPILIPLLISAFRRADELADAMDSRCYKGSKGRTKMKRLKFSLNDLIGVLFFINVFFIILIDKFVFLAEITPIF
ncbi:MAG: energy-coupling factor transporter transmembrane protein EcfT [Firmicutes bacterium]|jgi:energy-coupling factor transport system permease protein|nr:energy-coupling factor transporter transmembrane protein EcfT [Bacillota bacterium]